MSPCKHTESHWESYWVHDSLVSDVSLIIKSRISSLLCGLTFSQFTSCDLLSWLKMCQKLYYYFFFLVPLETCCSAAADVPTREHSGVEGCGPLR